MKKPLLLFFVFLSITSAKTLSQSSSPKREFRGAWVATVVNLDWPSSPFLSPESQRAELARLFDELHSAGVNAIIFQIRSEADAMYLSALEPWSYWLTGAQGAPPSPFYDPLEFAIQEAHNRGMELHAWFNPYRVSRQVGNYPNDPMHVSVQHPEWVIQIGTIKILDPGLPQARQHITNVVMDVVNRYDVDGVHFDDYFYPYPPDQISNQDAVTFATYNRGFSNLGDWRRDNVNLLIQAVHDSIQVIKPHVKFGISPFGIWKNGVPAGITGLDAYNTIYCDAPAWLARQIIDYITPQLYWPFGGNQDYGKLMPWWSQQTNGRHFYPGQAAYRVASWATDEIPRQIRANRNNPAVGGSIFFRALYFRENPKGLTDSLTTNYYRYPSLSPVMTWKDSVPPNAPQNLKYARLAGTGTAGLRWDLPVAAADGDTASRYVVYGFDHSTIQPDDLDDPSNIAEIVGMRMSTPPASLLASEPVELARYFVVTALDRNSNESLASDVLSVTPPATPVLAFPAAGAPDQAPIVTLSWFYPERGASYQLQVTTDSTFGSGFLVNETGLVDTFRVVSELEGQTNYYWRVRASNPAGASDFSDTFDFATGFPATPALAYPQNNTGDIPLDATIVWHTTPGASTYDLQVSRSLNFEAAAIVIDEKKLVDTSYAVASLLEPSRFYFWRVSATNAIGAGLWSESWRFKTGAATAVAEAPEIPRQLALHQNYPNPFNPLTTIVIELPEAGLAQLMVFDVLGREVTTLVDAQLHAGPYEFQFNASALPSGMYLYRLRFGRELITRRMVLVK